MRTKRIAAVITAIAVVSAVLPGQTAVPVQAAAKKYKVIKVTAKSGFRGVKNALDKARDKATTKKPYKVVLGKGTYKLDYSLHIYSNTYLDASKATIKLNNKKAHHDNLIRIGTPGNNDPSHGFHYKNITIKGGKWDRGGDSGTTMKLAHAKNVKVMNAELYNCFDGHLIETAAVDGLTINNCYFHDTKGNDIKNEDVSGGECIQIDILVKNHFNGYKNLDNERDYVSKNITISNCRFKNVVRAAGSHTAVYGNPFKNVKFLNNKLSGISDIGFYLGGMQDLTISGNTIRSANNCIEMYVIKDTRNGNYLSKTGSNEYVDPDINAEISGNKIVSTKANGIYLHGTKFLTDGAGDRNPKEVIPAGDYALNNINIHNNTIKSLVSYKEKDSDTWYSPIKIVNGNNVSVAENNISGSDNAYYLVYVKDGSKKVSITGNTISSKCRAGIKTYLTDPDTDQFDKPQIDEISNNNIDLKNGVDGISLSDATVGNVTDNTISNTSDHLVWISDTTVVDNLRGNTMSNSDNRGITIVGSVTDISDNEIKNTRTYAMALENGAKISIINNNIINKCESTGIMVHSDIDRITGNNISDVAENGIMVARDGVVGEISSNTIKGRADDNNRYGIRILGEADNVSSNTISGFIRSEK